MTQPLSHATQQTEWQPLAEFTLSIEPGDEHLAMQQVAAAVQELHLPPARLRRLKMAVTDATLRAIEYRSKYRLDLPLSIRVLASQKVMAARAANQGSSSPPSAAQAPEMEAKLASQYAPRGWGFFLIERKVAEMKVSGDPPRHIIELFLYLEGEQGGSETYQTRRDAMYQTKVTMDVRKATDKVSIVDIQGGVTSFAENALMDAYTRANTDGTRAIILNFSDLEYMNSSGIGLLITFLIRANRQGQQLLAFGLNEHYQHIFALTRLNEVIQIYDTEAEALAAVG
jgi:anti-sigma B factor antagonist